MTQLPATPTTPSTLGEVRHSWGGVGMGEQGEGELSWEPN